MRVIELTEPFDGERLYSEIVAAVPGVNAWVTLMGEAVYLSDETPALDTVELTIRNLIMAHSPRPLVQALLPGERAPFVVVGSRAADAPDIVAQLLEAAERAGFIIDQTRE